MTAIINAELVLKDHLIPDGVLFMEDGIITGFGEKRNTPIPENCDIIDAKGAYVGPGFVDIHTHAANKIRFNWDPPTVARYHMEHGTTTVLPALYFSLNKEKLVEAIMVIRNAMDKPGCENIAGLYMEGPYMNPCFGSDRESCPWAGPIDPANYMPVLEAGAGIVRVWAVAPERENILDFVKDAKKMDPTVKFAVGHSEAEPHHIEPLMDYGLCLGTHHTNATGTIVKYPECRGVCVDETVNYNSEIYAELISDSRGVHVDPYMQRLVRKIKGDDRIILISDATSGTGAPLPGFEGVTDINFDHAGEIDGSNLTLNVACRNFMVHTGASVVDVFKFAARNPAKAIGMTDRGEIAVGKRADLVFVDHRMNVEKVIFEGKEI